MPEVWLHVAEKPSVAKAVAQILSGQSPSPPTTRSQSRFNPVFDFRHNVPTNFNHGGGRGGGSMMNVSSLVTSVAGHLMETDFPPHAKGWSSIAFVELFRLPIVKSVKKEFEPVSKNIEGHARRATRLVLWLDCDREGENICTEVMEVAQRTNPRIAISRAKFSALTERDVMRAIATLGTVDMAAAAAVNVRSEMDLRVGAVFTRFQTVKFRDNFSNRDGSQRHNNNNAGAGGGGGGGRHNNSNNDNNNNNTPNMPSLWSFGPCQFPCLGMVVRRKWERDGFIRELYAYVELKHNPSPTTTVNFRWDRGNIFDMSAAVILAEMMQLRAAAAVVPTISPPGSNTADSSPATAAVVSASAVPADHAKITDVQHRPSTKRTPSPLATVQMQQLAATHLGLSSERCMQLAEGLYQEGFLSYPRTETDSYTYTDQELQALVQVQSGSPLWGGYAQQLLPQAAGGDANNNQQQQPNNNNNNNRYRRPIPGGHDDKAHPPIHPTKLLSFNTPGGRGGVGGGDDRERLYALVARHFLASCSMDAVAAEIQVQAVFGGEGFHASGQTITHRNFLDVATWVRWASSAAVPNYSIGDVFIPSEVRLHEGQTEPPPLLTEANLIKQMDTEGIGTDATIATHIKTIQDRGYAMRSGDGVFSPTPVGESLIAAYSALGLPELWQPQLRAQMEAACADVASGRAAQEAVTAAAIAQYRQLFLKVQAGEEAFRTALSRFLGQPTGEGFVNGVRRFDPFTDGTPLGGFKDSRSACSVCGAIASLRFREGTTQSNNNSGAGGTNTSNNSTNNNSMHNMSDNNNQNHQQPQQSYQPSIRCGDGKACPFKIFLKSAGASQITLISSSPSPSSDTAADTANAASSMSISSQSSSNNCQQCGRKKLRFRWPSMSVAPPGMDPVEDLCVLCSTALHPYIKFVGQQQQQQQQQSHRPPHPPSNISNQSNNNNSLLGSHQSFMTSSSSAGSGVASFNASTSSTNTTFDSTSRGRGGGGQRRQRDNTSATDTGGGYNSDAADSSSNNHHQQQYQMPDIHTGNPTSRGGRGGGRGGTRGGRGGGGNNATNTSDPNAPPCKCNTPARQSKSKTQANPGRLFWTCAKPRGQGCDFFQWCDA